MDSEKKYHHGNLRELLISEGLKMLNAEGFDAFSMRKLATKLEVSHTAAYRHFADKEKLLEAIFNDSAKKFYEALIKSVSSIKDPKERIDKLGVGYIKFFVDNPEMLTIFQLGNHLNQQSPETATGDYFNAFDFFKGIAQQVPKNEVHKDLNDMEILIGYWGKVHGLACLLVSQREAFSELPKKQLNAMIENIVKTPF